MDAAKFLIDSDMGRPQSTNMIVGRIIPLATMIFLGAHFSAKGSVADFHSFLDHNCVKCHSGDKPKGDLLLDHVAADFTDKTSREQWERVLEQLESGSMPPKSKPRPPATEQRALCDWIISEVTARRRNTHRPRPATPPLHRPAS